MNTSITAKLTCSTYDKRFGIMYAEIESYYINDIVNILPEESIFLVTRF